jgi:HD-GYP domain-containing protein (c-di-GMP phosphodiesterase class II)
MSFLPFALLLTGSFWTIHKLVESKVREGLVNSLREADKSAAEIRKKGEMQNSRFLQIVGENPSLKAGLQLLLAQRRNKEARLTVEDQLKEICQTLHFDYLLASDTDNRVLAGVYREGNMLPSMDVEHTQAPTNGILDFSSGTTFQVTSIFINQGDENIGRLVLGERFDINTFTVRAVLVHEGKVVKSNLSPVIRPREVEAEMASCHQEECELQLQGETYITLPRDSIDFGGGFKLYTLQNVDSANGPVQSILKQVFMLAGVGCILVALVFSMASSRTIVQPLAGVVATLHESEKTGLLPQFQPQRATILEIRELAESFNRAGASIREAREKLQRAYVEFIGSLAGALDARDPYTAGHSRRVSEYSCNVAVALSVPAPQIEEIRVGALLHDLGKVGISDNVLRKPGRLSAEEFALLKQHPVIGRRILEGVAGFQMYLPVVELHHENWDGTGYPLGLRAEDVPLGARIVHVADAYDAMTSDRPYRPGFSHEHAIAELLKFSGTQFDPAIVAAFVKLDLPPSKRRPSTSQDPPGEAPPAGLHLV